MQKTLAYGECFFIYANNDKYFSRLFKHPFFVEGEACDDVDDVCKDVCKEAGLHVLRDELGEGLAPSGAEQVDGRFERHEVERVGRRKDDDEADDFGALAAPALEIPDAVHQVTIDGAEDETQEIRQFQVPVQELVHHPDRGQGDERVYDADDIVLDEMLHEEENRK